MPELPEIETIKRGLEQVLPNRKIVKITILEPKIFQVAKADITDKIIEQKISTITRRGKGLIWKFNNGFALVLHLKMTGQIVILLPDGARIAGGHPTKSILPHSKLPDGSTRVIFELDDKTKVFFNDQRKFGWIKLLNIDLLDEDSFFGRLGPEPFSKQFNLKYLRAALSKRSAPIKPVLLDQSVVAGLGNIYVDESLFLAGINPQCPANKLSSKQVAKLLEVIKRVLSEAIEHGGTTFSDFVDAFGGKGDYINHARVFGREGEPCRICKTPIKKIKFRGRGTHFCPNCQRKQQC